MVFFNAFQGVREVDGNLVNNVRILGASRMQVIRNVVLPSAMTWIIASLHVAFGFAIIGAIVGEVLGAQHGLGVLITDSGNNFDANGVFAGMIIIGVIALVAEWLISLLERRLLAWRPQTAAEASPSEGLLRRIRVETASLRFALVFFLLSHLNQESATMQE